MSDPRSKPWQITALYIVRDGVEAGLVAEYPDVPVTVYGLREALQECAAIVRAYHGLPDTHPKLTPLDIANRVPSYRVQHSDSGGNTKFRHRYTVNDVPYMVMATVKAATWQPNAPTWRDTVIERGESLNPDETLAEFWQRMESIYGPDAAPRKVTPLTKKAPKGENSA